MAKIYNSDCTKGLAQNAGIQQSVEKVPNELAEKIVPTFETNPSLLRRTSVIATGHSAITETLTVLSSSLNPKNRRIFITDIDISYYKDAACDRGSFISLQLTPKGKAATDIVIFPILPLTQQADSKQINFNFPLELEQGTAITYTGTFTAGKLIRACTIYGYYVDNVNV